MNRGIYATANGMVAAQQMLDVIAQNLANASTTGYKRDAIAFDEALVRELRDDNGALGTLGIGPEEQSRFTIFDAGPITSTGNDLDVAIRSQAGAFAIQTDHGVRYTRDGSFTRSSDGQLVTHQGFPVLDDQGRPISLPEGGELDIGADGTVSNDGLSLAKLGVFEGEFVKEGGNLFSATNVKPIDDPDLIPQSIEGSNVNTIESMVAMIQINRSYEMAQRSITQQDELTQKLIQSLPSQ